MLSELEILESLVLNKLSLNYSEASNPTFEELVCIAHCEQKKIKNKLVETFFNLTDEVRFEFYIHKIQNDLTQLADHVYAYLDTEDAILSFPQNESLTLKAVHVSVYLTLDELLESVETQFSKYFNLDAKIPKRKRALAIRQFSSNLDEFNSYKQRVQPRLFVTIIKPINEFIDSPNTSTYRRLYFLKHYLKEILCVRDIEDSGYALSIHITRQLVFINFNSISFFNLITNEIKSIIDDLDDVSAKLEQLSWYLKEINQTPVLQGIIYNPNLSAIKELLSEWTVDEICHVEKNMNRICTSKELQKHPPNQEFKLATEFSVPQYAFFLRTLIETNLYNHKDEVRQYARLFASISQTKGTDAISPESLRQLFYNESDKTREVVKAAVIKILNYIQNLKIVIILLSVFQDYYAQVFDIIL